MVIRSSTSAKALFSPVSIDGGLVVVVLASGLSVGRGFAAAPVTREGGFEHIVDSDDADDVVVVNDGQVEQVVVSHQQGDTAPSAPTYSPPCTPS